MHLKRTVVIHSVLLTPATVPLFAKQAVIKQALAIHTSAIEQLKLAEQLKHATDTGMRPIPSVCIACTDTDSSKMHTQVSCFHPLRLTFCFLLVFIVIN